MISRVASWFSAVGFASVGLPAQLTQSSLAGPTTLPAYYDDVRDVLVCWGVSGSTVSGMWEFDGANWAFLTTSFNPLHSGKSVAFDRGRGVLVVVDQFYGDTWEWDGANLVNVGPAPVVPLANQWLPNSYNFHVAYHETRQRVMLFSESFYEWDGASWRPVLSANTPPVIATPFGPTFYRYGGMTYDARLDKMVLCGRIHSLPNSPVETKSWEWDPATGWVEYPASGPLTGGAVWFDEHRGVVLKARTINSNGYHGVYYRDTSRAWVQLQSTDFDVFSGCYDRNANRFFFATQTGIGILHDVHPAAFGSHAPGCTPASPWNLTLSQPGTRAWIGRTFAVEVGTPSTLALLAMGFSDQLFQSVQLPFDLTAAGLTGCSLNVAPDAIAFGAGSAGSAAFALAIPNGVGLLGTTFFQQGFALAPGANPAGLVATDSVRATVGRFQ